MKLSTINRTRLLVCTALAPVAMMPSLASAQDAAAEDTGGLEEIVVTAQKREQSLQDVPVAVTAISQASLETNRITSVQDLNGIAPNVSVRPAAGGTQIASFSVRGVNSYGVVPGSDKQVSINLDGVYISRHAVRSSTSPTSPASKFCAARRARCSAATPLLALSASSPATPTASSASSCRARSATMTSAACAPRSTPRSGARSAPM